MKKLIFAILLTVFSTSASAENNYYFGVGAGPMVIDGEYLIGGGLGMSVFGGYQLNQTYKVELGIHYASEIEDEPATIQPLVFNASILASTPITENLDGFARLGITSWDADIDFSGINLRTSSGTDITLGFGFELKTSETISWRQEYLYFQFDDDDVHSLFFNINYHF